MGCDMTRYSQKWESALAKHITSVDEYSWEIEDGVQDEVVRLAEKAIEEAGKALKLALPLAAEGKMSFQGSWKDVH